MAICNNDKQTRSTRNLTLETLMQRELLAADLAGVSEAVNTEPAMIDAIDKSTPMMIQAGSLNDDGEASTENSRVRRSRYLDKASPMLLRGQAESDTDGRKEFYVHVTLANAPTENSIGLVDGHVTVLKSQQTDTTPNKAVIDGHVTVLKARDTVAPTAAKGDSNGHVTVLKSRHIGPIEATWVDYDSPCLGLAHIHAAGSAVLTTDGVLFVTGTASADTIEVVRDHLQLDVFLNGVQIPIDVNGTLQPTVLYSDVSEIKIYGGCGDDVISVGEEDGDHPIHESLTITIYGESGDDTIYGSNGDDDLFGGTGDDLIYGFGGADLINGGAGDDELHGGQGHDTIFGESGNDWIWGGWGSDTIDSGTDNPVPIGGGATLGDVVIDAPLVAAAPSKLAP